MRHFPIESRTIFQQRKDEIDVVEGNEKLNPVGRVEVAVDGKEEARGSVVGAEEAVERRFVEYEFESRYGVGIGLEWIEMVVARVLLWVVGRHGATGGGVKIQKSVLENSSFVTRIRIHCCRIHSGGTTTMHRSCHRFLIFSRISTSLSTFTTCRYRGNRLRSISPSLEVPHPT